MAANTNLEIVHAVLAAIQAQNADRALQRIDPQFVQHYSFIGDGASGLRQYITGSKPEDLQFRVVRSIQDGPYVVVQLQSESTQKDMFAVYRLDKGRIAEHWAFDAPIAPPNQSGHTQVDGPVEAQHLENAEKNKLFLRNYYETFHIAGDHNQNERFFTGDLMIRHEPGVRDGLSNFLEDVEHLMQHRTIDQIKLLAGEGDLVFVAAKGTHEGAPCVYIDLYRVEKEKVVEHWGFPQAVAPRNESRNKNDFL